MSRGSSADVLVDRGELDEALRIRREEELPVYERLGDMRERAITLGKIVDRAPLSCARKAGLLPTPRPLLATGVTVTLVQLPELTEVPSMFEPGLSVDELTDKAAS